MKKLIYFLIALILGCSFSSCSTVYKCNQLKPDKSTLLWSKRLKTVVSERDQLCKDLNSSEKENLQLKKNVSDLTAKNKDINDRYNDLTDRNNQLQEKYQSMMSDNLSQTEKLNRALKIKSDELDTKEKLLSEREKALEEMQHIVAKQDSIAGRLNNILRNALLGFNADELSVEVKNGKVYVSMTDKLLFRSGSATVEQKGKEALKLLGEVLDKNPDIDILVEGHTDNIPIKTQVYKDNWDLSVVRATSIVRILTADYKIAPRRMTASGRGEYFPRAGNDTAEGRARNRRTEIILSPKLDELIQLLNG